MYFELEIQECFLDRYRDAHYHLNLYDTSTHVLFMNHIKDRFHLNAFFSSLI